MSLLRRLSAGRLEGDAVYARLRATESMGDEPMWQELMSSAVGRAGARLIDLTDRAAAESAAVHRMRTVHQAWATCPPVLRLRGIGVMSMAAVATHLALVASVPIPGVWRLLLPGLAGAFGLVVLGLSYCGPRQTGARD